MINAGNRRRIENPGHYARPTLWPLRLRSDPVGDGYQVGSYAGAEVVTRAEGPKSM